MTDPKKSRIDVLTEALKEIRDYKFTVTRHWNGPSPEDELEATVPEDEAEYMQDVAYNALLDGPISAQEYLDALEAQRK